ncbi:MAG: hypothetical protein N3G19_02935 [Candidatus Pacearchaeota archaeon]|nr:hypothetical protein [Candidatus Pacearchaeota archaeon]
MPKKLKSSYEKEFLEAFAKKAIVIKERKEKEKLKEEKIQTDLEEKAKTRKETAAEKIALLEKKLRPSIREKEDKKARAIARTKLKEISVEHEVGALPKEKPKEEKAEMKEKMFVPKPTPSTLEVPAVPATPPLIAPTYQRALPPLPKPPKLTPTWPLPPPPKITRAPAVPKIPAVAPYLDLDKLNTFIQDTTVTMIQCDGANLPIKIKKEGKLQETVVTLTEDEIKLIIKKFADRTNQPISEPIFKTQLGNIAITAIISSYAGSKFVISKV